MKLVEFLNDKNVIRRISLWSFSGEALRYGKSEIKVSILVFSIRKEILLFWPKNNSDENKSELDLPLYYHLIHINNYKYRY